MGIKGIGHILLRVADIERSKAFYQDVLGFRVSEEDPEHGGVFMTLGETFHTLDLAPHPQPHGAPRPTNDHIGLIHAAFEVEAYADLRQAYCALQSHGVELRAVDHVSQRSLYFSDPDGNGLEVYYEVPGALQRYEGGRNDEDTRLPVTRPGEPLPSWLEEQWPPA